MADTGASADAPPAKRDNGAENRELPRGKIDIIYTGGFPPFWKPRSFFTVTPEEFRRRRRKSLWPLSLLWRD